MLSGLLNLAQRGPRSTGVPLRRTAFERRIHVLTKLDTCQYNEEVPTSAARTNRTRERRVSRTYRLPLSKIEAAKRALGASTATETIERALDLVLFQRALVRGTKAMLGVTIASPD